jgi:hypothetical protein
LSDRPFGAGFLTVLFAAVLLAAAFFTGVVRAWAIGRDSRGGTIPCVVARWVRTGLVRALVDEGFNERQLALDRFCVLSPKVVSVHVFAALRRVVFDDQHSV